MVLSTIRPLRRIRQANGAMLLRCRNTLTLLNLDSFDVIQP